MGPQFTQQQRTLEDHLEVSHITLSIPIEDGKIAIGFHIEARDPDGVLIHSEAWSRGSFTSDTHCLLTAALTLRRILQAD